MINLEPPNDFQKRKVLRCHVIKSKGLIDPSLLTGRGEVFAEVVVTNKVFRTKAIPHKFADKSTPIEWNELFEVAYEREPFDIEISVFRKNKVRKVIGGAHDKIGWCIVNCGDTHGERNANKAWFTLKANLDGKKKTDTKKGAGKLLVHCEWGYDPDELTIAKEQFWHSIGIADQQSKEFWRNLHRHRAKVVQQALERGESQPAFPELPADRKVGFQYVGE